MKQISLQLSWEFSDQPWVTAPTCTVLSSSTQETTLNLHTNFEEPWMKFRSIQFLQDLRQMDGKQAGMLEKTNALSSLMMTCFLFVISVFLFFFVQPMYVSLSYFDFSVVFPPVQLVELRPQKERNVGHVQPRRLLFCFFSYPFPKSEGASRSLGT